MKTPTTETRRHGENRVIGSSGRPFIMRRTIGYKFAVSIRHALSILRAALREIFDESAYERFLTRTKSERTVTSYRAFLRERETAIARKPRCC
jgi:hypothetical protein